MTDELRNRWHVSPQIVFGIAIVFFGLMLTAENLGIATNITRVIRFWPMVFTAAGLAMLLDRDSSGSRKTFGAILVVGGVWQTANTAFGLNLYIDEWWPLIIVGLGILMITRAVRQGPSSASSSSAASGAASFAGTSAGASGIGSRDDVVSAFALMSAVKRNIFSPTFRRANLTAVMGGVEIDLRQCPASGGESVIDIFAMWGGIQIRVPPDWQVVSEVLPIMGGVDDKSGHVQPFRHRLVIKGVALMGGAEVKS